MRKPVFLLIMCIGASCVVVDARGVALAHETRPAAVDIREIPGGRYQVLWRTPLYYGRRLPVEMVLPSDWQLVGAVSLDSLPSVLVERRVVAVATGGLDGSVLGFAGLEATTTDVFVRVARLDGSTSTAIARPTRAWVQLRGERTWGATAEQYLGLGIHHILLGIDHLLFVLGLLLIVSSRSMLLKTVSSFTVAHSITLAAATLGLARVPLPPLNAAVALSIFFLGPEIVRSWRGQSSLTIRYPWIVAFVFGLLHGFGFASGLSTAAMPHSELPMALLCFNLGVELGQLLFVCLVLALLRAFRVLEIRWARWVSAVPGYTVGVLGAYWTIQRSAMLFGVLR